MEIVKVIFRFILNSQGPYRGDGMMMALFFIALFVIAFICNEVEVRERIIIPICVTTFALYFFLALYVAIKTYIEEAYQGRIFWILITPIVTAMGFTIIITNITEKKKRIMAIVALLPICLLCGEFKISRAMFRRAENMYRLPQACVDMTDYITKDNDAPLIIVPYTIAHPFRQLSTKVHMLYGEDASYGRIAPPKDERFKEMCEEMERATPNLNMIVPIANEYGVDYIVFDTVYTEFCKNGNINIYGYPVDENYVGDRTPMVSYEELKDISVVDDGNGIYWDLSSYGLSYDGTYGQYILYKFDHSKKRKEIQ